MKYLLPVAVLLVGIALIAHAQYSQNVNITRIQAYGSMGLVSHPVPGGDVLGFSCVTEQPYGPNNPVTACYILTKASQ